jgi:hypothetical protein
MFSKPLKNHGEPGGTRTRDHRIKSAMLYQLSYRPLVDLDNFSYINITAQAFSSQHSSLQRAYEFRLPIEQSPPLPMLC